MAIPQNTLIGKTKQSVGGTTFSSWKGINVLKSKAVAVANPNTIPQQNQRAKMRALVQMYQQATPPIKFGMVERAVQMSEFNAFTGINLKNGSVTATSGVATIIPQNIVISAGSLDATQTVAKTVTVGSGTVIVTFDTTATGDQLATDQSNALWLDQNGVVKGFVGGGAARSTGTVTVAPVGSAVWVATDKLLFGMSQAATKKAENSRSV